MKKLEVVIDGRKANEVSEALAKENIPRITVFDVKGTGSSQGRVREYRGCRYIEESADIKIEIVVDDEDAERLSLVIVNALQTGKLGNGELVILPVEQKFRLRVGQHESSAQLPSSNSKSHSRRFGRNCSFLRSTLLRLFV